MRPALVAIIPSRFEPDRLRALLDVVVPETDRTIVLDNGHREPICYPDPRVEVVPTPDSPSIYAWWNDGVRRARAVAELVDVAILNDDVRILPGTLTLLARALRSRPALGVAYPDVRARLREGLPRRVALSVERDPVGDREMTGYCFVFRGDLPLEQPFDERYTWWYGDTQFDEVVRVIGYGVARVNRVPIEHSSDAERNGWRRRPELERIVEEDGRRFDALHRKVVNGCWWPLSEEVGRR